MHWPAHFRCRCGSSPQVWWTIELHTIVPKHFFFLIAQRHLGKYAQEHVKYHEYKIDQKKTVYRSAIGQFVKYLQALTHFDCVLTANYVYAWQQEIAEFCRENGLPFYVLHKEGLTSPNAYNDLLSKYSNGQFIGDAMFLYNSKIKSTMLSANVHGLTKQNLISVGIPRFDEYLEASELGEGITFFFLY